MYEELMNIVQTEYKPEDSSDTDITQEGKPERKQWQKQQPREQEEVDIGDSSSDDDMDRNVDASPIRFGGKKIGIGSKY